MLLCGVCVCVVFFLSDQLQRQYSKNLSGCFVVRSRLLSVTLVNQVNNEKLMRLDALLCAGKVHWVFSFSQVLMHAEQRKMAESNAKDVMDTNAVLTCFSMKNTASCFMQMISCVWFLVLGLQVSIRAEIVA